MKAASGKNEDNPRRKHLRWGMNDITIKLPKPKESARKDHLLWHIEDVKIKLPKKIK